MIHVVTKCLLMSPCPYAAITIGLSLYRVIHHSFFFSIAFGFLFQLDVVWHRRLPGQLPSLPTDRYPSNQKRGGKFCLEHQSGCLPSSNQVIFAVQSTKSFNKESGSRLVLLYLEGGRSEFLDVI